MSPLATAVCLVLALAAFVVSVALNGPDRWRAPLTWVAVGLGLWLTPSLWAAVTAA